MPQFDTVTFFNQIFWFFSIFLSFYFIILKGLLPVVAISLKTRKKLVYQVSFVGSANAEGLYKKNYINGVQKIVKIGK